MKSQRYWMAVCFSAVLACSAVAMEPLTPTADSQAATQAAVSEGLIGRMLREEGSVAPFPASLTSFGARYAGFAAEEEGGCEAAIDDCGCPAGGCGDEPCGSGLFGWGDSLFCGIEFGGWIQQGFSAVANNPADRFNGVVGPNDRHAEYQMNQLWLYAERETETCGCGWDIGGRVDVLYGTDAEFYQAVDGMEANWHQTERFYQAAIPQFYLDVAVNDWTVRMGRFITPLGYEHMMAPENFFYSLSHLWMYGVPATHLGMTVERTIGDNWLVFAGFHRGGDQFDDTDGKNALNFLGGVSWWSDDECTWVDFVIDAEEFGPDNPITIMSLMGGTMLTQRLKYAIEYTTGQADGDDAEWYGILQEFIYEINCCWSAGVRFEWFRDDDGYVVFPIRDGNLNQGPFVGNFYDLTLGLNWQPRERLMVRPQVRWDWYDEDTPGGPLPFDAGDRDEQFMGAVDVIWTF